MKDKILIAYVTKGGVTEEVANVIAGVLRDKYSFEVDIVNLKDNKSPNISQYRNVIVGYGVRMQKVYGEALKFLETDFKDKNVAVFVSSIEVGDPKGYEGAVQKYIKNTLEKYPHVKPVATEVFGGRISILGRTLIDKRDMTKVSAWAEELGKKLSS